MAENHDNRPADEVSIGEEKEARTRARIKRNLARANSKKKTQYFNLFDVFIIFVILVSLTLLVLGVRVSDIFGAGQQGRECALEYQVCFSEVDENFAAAIRVGDGLYDTDSKLDMGIVVSEVLVEPSKIVKMGSYTESGLDEVVTLEGKVDIIVTVAVAAVYTEGVGYTVDGLAVRVGDSYTLRSPGYVGQGICVALKEASAAQ